MRLSDGVELARSPELATPYDLAIADNQQVFVAGSDDEWTAAARIDAFFASSVIASVDETSCLPTCPVWSYLWKHQVDARGGAWRLPKQSSAQKASIEDLELFRENIKVLKFRNFEKISK